ncbi:MAG: hemerythrin domain-containing protein [Betaproteobacteria bacterium]|nr:hemerythrin domain-containing protein [Betaproteobacteria bacterium]
MFDFLFRRKTETPAPAPASTPAADVAPGTHLHYDPHLTPELLADHKALLGQFGAVLSATGKRDSSAVIELLNRFGDDLRGHILKENIRLYVYLKHSLQNDEDSLEIMQGFSREMHQIGRAVTDFLHRYTHENTWDEAHWVVFERDLKGVGGVLGKRIQTEESVLYPLYLPPTDYA